MSSIESPSAIEGHYVLANGLNVFYEAYGSGTPLILLHGATGTLD